MSEPIHIRSDDPILKDLHFKTYRYTAKRRAEQFLPEADQPQTIEVETRWGDTLTGKRGDYLVSDFENPEKKWVVEEDIFGMSYKEVEGGVFIKNATVDLVPLTEITHDQNQEVIVHSLEGPLKVRAGDYYLARGVKEELWLVALDQFKNYMVLSE